VRSSGSADCLDTLLSFPRIVLLVMIETVCAEMNGVNAEFRSLEYFFVPIAHVFHLEMTPTIRPRIDLNKIYYMLCAKTFLSSTREEGSFYIMVRRGQK